jgi:NadR type nicotinamide-nucleotide adenylyltransferase
VSAPFRRGLVVGKFAPLHRGHELVIGRARAACDELLLLSYSRPERPGCDPRRRARWLEQLFPWARRLVLDGAVPDDSAPDEEHRRFVARVCLEQLGGPVDAVFTSEDYGDGFARTLTAVFQQHDPRLPPVTHVLVDRARHEVPISGSAIRADVHAHRRWLSPAVYASFVERVCLLGGESSGKTTLAAVLAEACGTVWVPEYGRRLWDEKAGALALPDMRAIAEHQVADEEEAALRAARWLFCDTSPLTTLLYSQEMFGQAEPRLEELARRPYHHTFLLAPDFPFVQDGTRREEGFRDRQHAWYLQALAGTPYHVLTGTVAQRIEQALRVLAPTSPRSGEVDAP